MECESEWVETNIYRIQISQNKYHYVYSVEVQGQDPRFFTTITEAKLCKEGKI